MRQFLILAAIALLPTQLSAQTPPPPRPENLVINTQNDWIAAIPRPAAATVLPAALREDGPWGQLKFAVKFKIARDGTLLDSRLLESSGNQDADNAIMTAIRGSSYPPFTPDMPMSELSLELPMIISNPKPQVEPMPAPFALPSR